MMHEQELLLAQLDRYYTLWRASLAMYEEWSRAHGLSYNSVMVLYSILENRDRCTQKMIAEKWFLPKQTIHTILKDFERRGYIRLTPSDGDRRNKYIRPTQAGERYAGAIVKELRELELFVLKRLGLRAVERINGDLALFVELFQQGVREKNVQP